MIESIRLKNIASFDEEGIEIKELKKVNYIYGSNGTGKTTISNFLNEPEEDSSVHENLSNCEMKWKTPENYPVYVYNQKFKETYFQQENIPGVFTVGKTAIEEQNKLASLYKSKTELELRIQGKRETLEKIKQEKNEAVESFQEFTWKNIKRKYEYVIQDAFKGFLRSKKTFAKQVASQSRKLSNSTETYDIDYFKSKNRQLYEIETKEIPTIRFEKEVTSLLLDIEKDAIWYRAIVGNEDIEIARMIRFLDNADWVRQGTAYLSKAAVCPFCQQDTLSDSFKRQLEQYFDEEYESSLGRIQKFGRYYRESMQYLESVLDDISQEKEYFKISDIDEEKYHLIQNHLLNSLKSNLSEIEKKEKEPSIKLELKSNEGLLRELEAMIEKINNSVFKYKETMKNIQAEKRALNDDFWTYCVFQEKERIDSDLQHMEGLNQGIRNVQRNIQKLKKEHGNCDLEIKNIETQMTGVQASIDNINRSLKSYSFEGFSIVTSPHRKNAYQIQRSDGSLVENSLSEGEETFISFLYFMELIKGANDPNQVSNSKIVVIDDPISSLDSTVLYIVSAMVNELIRDVCQEEKTIYRHVRQVIVLTHNVYFHKEISNPYHIRSLIEKGYVNFWLLNKQNNISFIHDYKTENPVSSSYELLWRELRQSDRRNLVSIQNVMRRILENYFSILGKKTSYKKEIKKHFPLIEEQKVIDSLFMWLDDGSHSVYEDFYINLGHEDVERYQEIFKNIFVKTGHGAHYEMMMKLTED